MFLKLIVYGLGDCFCKYMHIFTPKNVFTRTVSCSYQQWHMCGAGLDLRMDRSQKFWATDTEMTLICIHFTKKKICKWHMLQVNVSLRSSMVLLFGITNWSIITMILIILLIILIKLYRHKDVIIKNKMLFSWFVKIWRLQTQH